jgi:hypothetical protein
LSSGSRRCEVSGIRPHPDGSAGYRIVFELCHPPGKQRTDHRPEEFGCAHVVSLLGEEARTLTLRALEARGRDGMLRKRRFTGRSRAG